MTHRRPADESGVPAIRRPRPIDPARDRFDAAWGMSNDLAGGFDDVPTTTGNPPQVVAPPRRAAEPQADQADTALG